MNCVDVLVPCYNYARFLERCVCSVLSQHGTGVRVLIIDDASTDNTPEVGQRLAALDSRVEFRRHEVNQGHIATYNEGLLSWASAAYCLVLSADDALTSGALARAVRLLNRHPEVGMTYGRALVIGDESVVNSPKRTLLTITRSCPVRHSCSGVAPSGIPFPRRPLLFVQSFSSVLARIAQIFRIQATWKCGCGSRLRDLLASFARFRLITVGMEAT